MLMIVYSHPLSTSEMDGTPHNKTLGSSRWRQTRSHTTGIGEAVSTVPCGIVFSEGSASSALACFDRISCNRPADYPEEQMSTGNVYTVVAVSANRAE